MAIKKSGLYSSLWQSCDELRGGMDLLDGQQRMTTLYDVARGKPPKFFDGNTSAVRILFAVTLSAML